MRSFAAAALALLLLPAIPVQAGDEGLYGDDYEEEGSQLKLLELNGYLRLRADLFHNLHLHGNSDFQEPLTERMETTTEDGDPWHPRQRDADTLAGANLRFRVEPTINVTEEVRILSQIDVLDNMVLGSTPDTYGTGTPSAMSESQSVSSDGVNALRDSLRVKRVWGEVITPLGQLRFGRMPLHWGMGMLYNDGNCLECDQGHTVDRIEFVVKIADHYFIPSWDFGAEGPTSDGRGTWQSHPIDMDQLDDVNQFTLVIARKDSPRDIEEALNNDEWVFNYGLFTVYRQQSLSLDIITDPEADPAEQSPFDMVERDYEAWTWDLWGLFIYRELKLEAEFAVRWGGMDQRGIYGKEPDRNPYGTGDVDILQFGLAARGSYSLLSDSLHINLEVAYASGDTDEGFGALDPMSQAALDGEMTNFRFSPDFHVDRILWRELIGRITDALVINPSVAYTITPGLGVQLDVVYSLCEKANSSPGDEFNLGLELDASVFYVSEQGFYANVTYGILFPFGGFERVQEETDPIRDWASSPGIAHTVQLRLGIRF